MSKLSLPLADEGRHGRAEADGLSPFKLDAAPLLRQLLGAPEALSLEWSRAGQGVNVRLTAPSGRSLHIDVRPGSDSIWSAAGHGLHCRRELGPKDPLRDPLLCDILKSLSARFGAGGRGMVDAMRAALEAVHRDDVKDRDYRNIEQTTGGTSGILRLGFRCNQNCDFCWQGRSWPSPPDELYFQWLEEFAARGLQRLTITGGEPTLSSVLPQLVERAARVHGMQVHLQSNAIRMRDPAYATQLARAGLSVVLVSLHSADAEISDRMTRAPGTHPRTLAGIGELLKAGVTVALNCVINTDNYAGLRAHAELVVQQFVRPFPDNRIAVVNYSQASDYHDQELFRRSIAPLDLVRPHLMAASRLLRDAGVPVAAIGSCGFPACVAIDAPELVDWNSRAALETVHLESRALTAAACAACAARPWCPGVRKPYLDAHGERGLAPFRQEPSLSRALVGGAPGAD
jgi:organic radical activating enzyme